MITAAVIMVVIISLLLLFDHVFTLQNFCCHFHSPATIISPWVIVSLLTPLLCWYKDPMWCGLCLPPHSLTLLPHFFLWFAYHGLHLFLQICYATSLQKAFANADFLFGIIVLAFSTSLYLFTSLFVPLLNILIRSLYFTLTLPST